MTNIQKNHQGQSYVDFKVNQSWVEVYVDSTIEIKDFFNSRNERHCAIYVGGRPHATHNRKFESGRPHLMEEVELLATQMRAAKTELKETQSKQA